MLHQHILCPVFSSHASLASLRSRSSFPMRKISCFACTRRYQTPITQLMSRSMSDITSQLTPTPCYVLAHGDAVETCAASSEQWLRQAARGAYTTARTIGGDAVFDLQPHIERLAKSSQLMLAEGTESKFADMNCALKETASSILTAETLRPCIIASLRAASTAFRELCQQKQGELRLTTLLTFDAGKLDVFTHASALPDIPTPPIKVQIRGVARSNALAKDSEWVRQRQTLQDAKPSDVNEILLMDEHGAVLEGMSSNFFVVADGKVVTPSEGILLGTVRDLVLKVCEQERIPVILENPRASDFDKWDAAFITSTSRLVLPIDTLELPDGSIKRFGPNGMLEKLQTLAAAAISRRSEKLL